MWHRTDKLCPDCKQRGKFNYLYEGQYKLFCAKVATCGFRVFKTALKP